MAMTDIIFCWTSDELKLQGVHFPTSSKDICVVMVHGMSGNYVDNYFGHVLGEKLQQNNIGFLFAHNRGSFHINDLDTKQQKADGTPQSERVGVVYERFEGCILDIDAWLDTVRNLGYKKCILVGHSLGGPKVVHYFFTKRPQDVVGIVLASPGDMVGLAKKPEYQPNYLELLKEAQKNVAEGNPRKLLSQLVWDSYQISSQTFLDLFTEHGPADILPVLRNPDTFPELAVIDKPILCIMGEHDDIAIRTLPEDMEVLKQKATGCPSFTTFLLPKADHVYNGKETAFAEKILEWVKTENL